MKLNRKFFSTAIGLYVLVAVLEAIMTLVWSQNQSFTMITPLGVKVEHIITAEQGVMTGISLGAENMFQPFVLYMLVVLLVQAVYQEITHQAHGY